MQTHSNIYSAIIVSRDLRIRLRIRPSKIPDNRIDGGIALFDVVSSPD